ncbi:MFS transporter, partial [Candidatus Marinimicrobia bacterium]|nr:MFS transporter [Candidatus Neomarinimicrobiota bacterium]
PVRGKMDESIEKVKINDFKNFKSLFNNNTNILVFLQGLFGTVPWAVFGTYMIDYLSSSLNYERDGSATFAITLVGGMAILSSVIGGFIGNKLYKKNPKYLPLFCGFSTILGVVPTLLLINVPQNNEFLLYVYASLTGLLIALTPPNMKVILMNVNNSFNRGKVFSFYNFSDDLGRGFGPFIIGSLLVFFFGSNIAFNIAAIFWILCGIIILFMYKTFPKEDIGVMK